MAPLERTTSLDRTTRLLPTVPRTSSISTLISPETWPVWPTTRLLALSAPSNLPSTVAQPGTVISPLSSTPAPMKIAPLGLCSPVFSTISVTPTGFAGCMPAFLRSQANFSAHTRSQSRPGRNMVNCHHRRGRAARRSAGLAPTGGAGAPAFEALFQRSHQVDDIVLRDGFGGDQLLAALLAADQVAQRVFIAILEGGRLERPFALLDDLAGNFHHLRIGLLIGDVGKGVLGLHHLIAH